MRTQRDQKDQFLLSQNRSNSGYDLDQYVIVILMIGMILRISWDRGD